MEAWLQQHCPLETELEEFVSCLEIDLGNLHASETYAADSGSEVSARELFLKALAQAIDQMDVFRDDLDVWSPEPPHNLPDELYDSMLQLTNEAVERWNAAAHA